MSVLLPIWDVATPPVTLSASQEEPRTKFLKVILFNLGTQEADASGKALSLPSNEFAFLHPGAFSERDLALKTAFLFSLSKACNLIVIISLTVKCLVLSKHLLCLPCGSFKQALLSGVCLPLLSALPLRSHYQSG